MQPDSLTIDEVRRMAAAIGLTRLSEQHMQQLHRAANVAQARRTTLPVAEITPADEPAHIFRLDSVRLDSGGER